MHYFYILRSLKKGKLYLGLTSDLKKRLASHNSEKNKATKPYAPFELLYYSAFKNQQDALESEILQLTNEFQQKKTELDKSSSANP